MGIKKVMTEWNKILQRKGYNLEKPDEIVVSLASILEEKEAKKGKFTRLFSMEV